MKYLVGGFVLWLLMRNRFALYAALTAAPASSNAAGNVGPEGAASHA